MKSSTASRLGKQNIEQRRATVRRQRMLISAAAALIVLYLVIAFSYLFRFEPKSYVNGIDVSRLSLRAAKEKLAGAADNWQLQISGPGGQSETLMREDLSLAIADASNAKLAIKAQPKLGWLPAIFREKRYRVDLKTSYDEAALESRMDGMEMLREDAMEAPEDAHLSVAEDGSYVIVPEKTGTFLKTDEARAIITDAVMNARIEADLSEAQVLPEIYQTDGNLQTRRDEWNAFMASVGLTYRVGDSEEVFDGPRIASLLDDDGEHVTLSYAKTADLMAQWRSEHDTYKSTFEFDTSTGRTVKIQPYGDYGFALNEEDTCTDVMERIRSHDRGTYTAQYYHEAPYTENHGLGGTYVEVNINAQHLWVYKDGECVCDTEVVTGLPIFGRVTYMGCYAIKKKQREVELGTEDMEGSDNPVVDYWLPFNAGEGIHDASWREHFGGKIWLTNGSHGCVNVPDWCMDDVYNNVEVGEAVVIYGSDYDEAVNDRNVKTVNEDYYYDVFYGEG